MPKATASNRRSNRRACSSISVGLTRNPCVLIIESMRPEEVEVTFLVPTHEVAGKNNRFVRETINLPKPFRCGLRRVPISLGYTTTAVHKLSRNMRRAILSFLI